MQFDPPLRPAILQKRYKRFLADIVLEDKHQMTVHCANPGSMLGLAAPGNRVWISDSQNPKRKLQFSLEYIEVGDAWVGVNTHLANKLAEEAIKNGKIKELTGYPTIRREVKYGQNSRIDFLLGAPDRAPCYVEVKSVTLSREPSIAEFPDSVTTRGTKHLGELSDQVAAGARAVQLFVIQRNDCNLFRPAVDIDPAYAHALTRARKAGVEIIAAACSIDQYAIKICGPIPIEIP